MHLWIFGLHGAIYILHYTFTAQLTTVIYLNKPPPKIQSYTVRTNERRLSCFIYEKELYTFLSQWRNRVVKRKDSNIKQLLSDWKLIIKVMFYVLLHFRVVTRKVIGQKCVTWHHAIYNLSDARDNVCDSLKSSWVITGHFAPYSPQPLRIANII